MISALPTWFKGIKYRSRLEASWAEFFDANGFNFQYEPQGFKGKNGECYLCDFLVELHPNEWSWVEVKPTLDFDPAKVVDFTCSTIHLPEDSGYPSGAMFVFVGKPNHVRVVSAVACNIEEDDGMWPLGQKEVRFVAGPWTFKYCIGCGKHRMVSLVGKCFCGPVNIPVCTVLDRWSVRSAA